MDKLLEKCNLSDLKQEEIENLSSPMPIKGTKSI